VSPGDSADHIIKTIGLRKGFRVNLIFPQFREYLEDARNLAGDSAGDPTASD
jgi:hypothetical protein